MKQGRKAVKRERFTETELRVPPLKGSIKASRLEEAPVSLSQYRAGTASFSTIPWDVVDKHILPYLDYRDTIAFGRSTKQWYRRIADNACHKFSIFLRQEVDAFIAKDTGIYQTKRVEQFEPVKGSFDKMTPMAIAYYCDIGRVTWNKHFKRISRVSKPWDITEIMREVFLMLTRIKDHGNVDSFKAYAFVNNNRLRQKFELEQAKRLEVLAYLKQHLLERGYDTTINIRVMKNANIFKLEPEFCKEDNRMGDKERAEETPEIKRQRHVLNALYGTISGGGLSRLKTFNFNDLQQCLLRKQLIFKIALDGF